MTTGTLSHPGTSHPGLSGEQVAASRVRHGPNVLTPPARQPWWKLWLAKFRDPIIRILLIAAVIATLAGSIEGKFAEGIGIIVAVLLATSLSFLNEYKANREFDILNQVSDDAPVKVIRSAAIVAVPRRDVVVDDIVLVELGEEVPADGEVVETVNLQIDESHLTGEPEPVAKYIRNSQSKIAIPENPESPETAYPFHKLFRGTLVADGRGMMQITAVGDETEMGRTARAAAAETSEDTPLTKQLDRLSKWIGVGGSGFAALTFLGLIIRGTHAGELELTAGEWLFAAIVGVSLAIGLMRVWLPMMADALELMGRQRGRWRPAADSVRSWVLPLGGGALFFLLATTACWSLGLIAASPRSWLPPGVALRFLHYFMVAVTIIVVAVPEGLAMSVTLSLAYSMRKMTATNNLVRRMHACETIGAATVICTDKTGTLTQNEMRVQAAHFPSLGLPAAGSDLSGEAQSAKATANDNQESRPVWDLVAEAIAANSTAHLSRADDTGAQVIGNPTEGALLLWLASKGSDYAAIRHHFQVQHQWTFSTERKFMATLGGAGGGLLHVKGAPEIVLSRCTHIRTEHGAELLQPFKTEIEEQLRADQARGMRTLGFAYRESVIAAGELDELAVQLTWLGFVAIADPIRPAVPAAMASCNRAGVAVKVVTGDNSATAKEVARQAGLWTANDGEHQLLTGPEFAALEEAQAQQRAAEIKVMSRARPLDKLRLVRLLKSAGQVVAVTGDGTNDAPALNYADVGLAMGKTGTAVAKEASDIILLDDSFQSIVNAILWGRSLYQNIQRFVLFQLTINVGALGIALLGPYLGVDTPLTVMQMLWINLIMDTFAALALATEPPQTNVMDQPPRKPAEFIVSEPMAWNIFGTGLAVAVVLLGMLLYFERGGKVTDHEESIFFSTFVLLQFWNLFNARAWGTTRSALSHLWENKAFLAIAAAILLGQYFIVTFGHATFRTEPLSVLEWLAIASATSIILIVGEVKRAVQRRFGKEKATL